MRGAPPFPRAGFGDRAETNFFPATAETLAAPGGDAPRETGRDEMPRAPFPGIIASRQRGRRRRRRRAGCARGSPRGVDPRLLWRPGHAESGREHCVEFDDRRHGFLLLFLLPPFTHRLAQRTRMRAVKGLRHRHRQRIALRVVGDHSRPGHRLQHGPVPAEDLHGGQQDEEFGESVEQALEWLMQSLGDRQAFFPADYNAPPNSGLLLFRDPPKLRAAIFLPGMNSPRRHGSADNSFTIVSHGRDNFPTDRRHLPPPRL